MKQEFLVTRTKMIGGGNSYNVYIKEREEFKASSITLRDGERLVYPIELFELKTNHKALPQGFDRLDAYNELEKQEKKLKLDILQSVFPETKQLNEFPLLWVNFPETFNSEEKIITVELNDSLMLDS